MMTTCASAILNTIILSLVSCNANNANILLRTYNTTIPDSIQYNLLHSNLTIAFNIMIENLI